MQVGSAAALICDTGALLDYLVENSADHQLFRDPIDSARTRYVPALVLVEVDETLGIRRLVTRDMRHFAAIRLRDGRPFDLVVHPTDPDRS